MDQSSKYVHSKTKIEVFWNMMPYLLVNSYTNVSAEFAVSIFRFYLICMESEDGENSLLRNAGMC